MTKPCSLFTRSTWALTITQPWSCKLPGVSQLPVGLKITEMPKKEQLLADELPSSTHLFVSNCHVFFSCVYLFTYCDLYSFKNKSIENRIYVSLDIKTIMNETLFTNDQRQRRRCHYPKAKAFDQRKWWDNFLRTATGQWSRREACGQRGWTCTKETSSSRRKAMNGL